MKSFSKIFCIDGSGNKKLRDADLKRPIYSVTSANRSIKRLELMGKSALSEFIDQCETASLRDPILIAADVVIGLPSSCELPWTHHDTFLSWLENTYVQIGIKDWRDLLIAENLSERTCHRPFVKVKKDTKKQISSKRLCDEITNGESVYCIDSGSKQVGRASLQFWFEVLMPLRLRYPNQLAVWPFEPIDDKPIVVAECYPTASQIELNLPIGIKRNASKVVDAILGLRAKNKNIAVDEKTWFHAVSSEDEFDTFTTAYSFASREDLASLMNAPDPNENCVVRTHEGWMLGLNPTTKTERTVNLKSNSSDTCVFIAKTHGTGERNRNEQESLGRSGNRGPKGPLISMVCRRINDGAVCGETYETNAQDVFQIKCPKCQSKKRKR